MIKWGAVIAAIIFLAIVAEALGQKYTAEANWGRAAIVREQGIAATNLKLAQAHMLLAALPYFLTFAIFLFAGLALIMIFKNKNQPTVNNYFLGVPSEQNLAYYYFDRGSGRVRFVGDGGQWAGSQPALQHQRPVYDQKDVIDG